MVYVLTIEAFKLFNGFWVWLCRNFFETQFINPLRFDLGILSYAGKCPVISQIAIPQKDRVIECTNIESNE